MIPRRDERDYFRKDLLDNTCDGPYHRGKANWKKSLTTIVPAAEGQSSMSTFRTALITGSVRGASFAI